MNFFNNELSNKYTRIIDKFREDQSNDEDFDEPTVGSYDNDGETYYTIDAPCINESFLYHNENERDYDMFQVLELLRKEKYQQVPAWKREQQAKARELTNLISRNVNSFSSDNKPFNEAMVREHRTIQQSFTRLCFQWLEFVASENYQTDLRNAASKEEATKFMQKVGELMKDYEKTYLPMI